MQPQARILPPILHAPRLTTASCEPVREIEITDELGIRRAIIIPAERALTVFTDGRELVTLTTLGASPELLVLGFLCNQQLIECAAIEAISVDWNLGVAQVTSRQPVRGAAAESQRIVAGSSGQGSIYARLISRVDAVKLPRIDEARIRASTLRQLLDTMRQQDSIHRHARSVHSCALFQGDSLLVSVEDVGRHNALDTISGWMALHGIRGGDKTLFTTGRLTGEMVIKSAQCGVPIVVSRNGVSSMGYDVAKKIGMALFGRAVGRHFQCFVGNERLQADD
ncbi:MAG: formate dehydrogenase accessory sulfurtransferase FdhD [Pseudomonadota bacterium]|nr:formate dehydrogenase accessory sulfurtransferase FdhD [Pseudomonadota bacterium]